MQMLDSTPPIQGGEVPKIRPVWPVAIGVICITYAVAALACSCSGFFTGPIYEWMMEIDRESGEHDVEFQIQADQVRQVLWAYLTLSAAALANSVLLLVSAIALIRLRSWSRRALIAWSIIEFVLIVVHSAIEIAVAARTANVLAQRDMHASIDAVWFEAMLAVAGLVALSAIVPIFLLIWFSRAKIKQQLSSWS